MNYLAHAYLSFNDPFILAGNMASDFIKGNKKFTYPSTIQKGIALHRAIDGFTDVHEATKAAKEVFRPAYRLYAAAFIDIVYDHFLANDSNEFPDNQLYSFSQQVYEQLEPLVPQLPESFQRMFPYMKMQNWLFNYQHDSGMKRSFEGLVRRSTYLKESEIAFALFVEHKKYLGECYDAFFPDVKNFAFHHWQQLMKE